MTDKTHGSTPLATLPNSMTGITPLVVAEKGIDTFNSPLFSWTGREGYKKAPQPSLQRRKTAAPVWVSETGVSAHQK